MVHDESTCVDLAANCLYSTFMVCSEHTVRIAYYVTALLHYVSEAKPINTLSYLDSLNKHTIYFGDLQWTYQFGDALSTRQVACTDHSAWKSHKVVRQLAGEMKKKK